MTVVTVAVVDLLNDIIVRGCMTVYTVGVPAEGSDIMVAVHRVGGKGIDLVFVTVLAVGRIAVCCDNLLDGRAVLGADRRVGADVPSGVVAGHRPWCRPGRARR